MPRRRAGALLPLEEAVLTVGIDLMNAGTPEFHGFALSRVLEGGDQRLIAHGTLYKVLGRLESNGLLDSRWETEDEQAPGRPRRRLYRVTNNASAALRTSHELARARPAGQVRLAPT